MNHGDFLITGPTDAPATLLLAHGAGAPMDSPFMQAVAEGLATHGIRCVRFEFPYMQRRREEGVKAPPNKMPVLEHHFREVYTDVDDGRPLFIGGKSMGGRVASMIADHLQATGLICLGYPFHPPGKPERTRTEHLADPRTPTLILQGERDPFGKPEEIASYRLAPSIQTTYLPDGDHDFKPRVKSGLTEQENLSAAVEHMAAFIKATRPS